jgi:hypothetical protein
MLDQAEDSAMNEEAYILDQADEEILTYDVSDEALETAADAERGGLPKFITPYAQTYWGCCSS